MLPVTTSPLNAGGGGGGKQTGGGGTVKFGIGGGPVLL